MVNQNLVLTGPPGIGKTTIIQKVCAQIKQENVKVLGFYTEEVRENGVRCGFDVVTLDGQRGPLARVNGIVRGPSVGKYTVDIASFERYALPILDQKRPGAILVLDEIGKMELFSQRFKDKVTQIINDDTRSMLVTIPIEKGTPIPLVRAIRTHPRTRLFTVDRNNRESIADDIAKYYLDRNSTRNENNQ